MKRPAFACGLTKTLLCLVLAFVLAGCVSSGPTPPPGEPAEKETDRAETEAPKAPPQPQAVSKRPEPERIDPRQPAVLAQVRPDLSAVLQGLFYRLQGRAMEAPGLVVFDPGIHPLDEDLGVDLSGFALKSISIRTDESVDGDPLHRKTEAVFHLSDSLGRQMFVIVAAVYLFNESAAFVRQAVAVPYYPDFADVRFMVLPAGRLPSITYLRDLPFEELFGLAAENALSREELSAIPSGPARAFKLMVFNMARTTPDRRLRVFASEDAASGRVRVKESLSLFRDGWTVALLDGEFAFNTSPDFFFHAGLTAEDGPGETRFLSRFSSRIQ